MKALIKVAYACNNSCVFCHSAQLKDRAASAVGVGQKIALAARLGCTTVVLSGGEPTMHPHLLDWARQVQAAGLGLGLVTNGRMLAYGELVRRLVAAGLCYVQLSLHGATAALHDGITRSPGSFDQSLQAVGNLVQAAAGQQQRGRALELTVNTVVTRQNLHALGELVELLAPRAGLRLKYSMLEPKGAALAAFDQQMPPLETAAARVGEALERGLARGLALAHEGFPLCLLWPTSPDRAALAGLACDLRSEGFAHMSEADEDDFFPVDANYRTFVPACQGCQARHACPGIYRQYLARRGEPRLHPVGGELARGSA